METNYISIKNNTSSRKNYEIYDKELLAIEEALTK